MPHLRIEYSSNVARVPKPDDLFAELHSTLHEVGGVNRTNCKSRIQKASDFFVADGSYGQAFVHLEVRLLEGRSAEIKLALGEALLQVLQRQISVHNSTLDLQTTVELIDIEKTSYFKHPAGTI